MSGGRAEAVNEEREERAGLSPSAPERRLVAVVMLLAVKDLTQRANAHADAERNREIAEARRAARRFFNEEAEDPSMPFNLTFCCTALGLDKHAVKESVARHRLNADALERLTKRAEGVA